MSADDCINNHAEDFHGLPVHAFSPSTPAGEQPGAGAVAWRLASDWRHEESPFSREESWSGFRATVELEEVRALVFGQGWYDGYDDSNPDETVRVLVGERSRLVNLEALFLGDLTPMESEISWLAQGDLAPLLEAFPGLRELRVRGGEGLAFPAARHEGLRVLRLESGGLPPDVVADVAAAELPALEYLELWLGDECYGGGATVEQLAPLLAGHGKPALRHLGVQNSMIQDEIAEAFATAPVVERLESLSLSMGALSDAGARALLEGQSLAHLSALDLSHHFLSEEMMLRVRGALEPSGVRVDLSDREARDRRHVFGRTGEDDPARGGRYIAVAE
ncbi:STM4015 family protein [Nocardiopsis ansamitocini]|uniref:Leucine-rich repeat domain-containing protein n=1 Tax=Nocardiopsis ansamitocini TaxID=1670832 RepID=A0A9W6UKY7_9ACTN|nr:STM4015 family protein [Nocardiopsis ansamitocini]GLU50479.1 hypothetical protein Nans01_48300 [Nocardiopsis ansamitocini]